MKTSIDLQRLSNETWPPLPRPARAVAERAAAINPTVRLGLILSVVAAITAVLLRGILEVPIIAIVMAVLVIGFVLSWRATGSTVDDDA
ncbi:MAG: hypothetical protein ACRDZ2_06015 [Ilumatobacteraceae bacterium]